MKLHKVGGLLENDMIATSYLVEKKTLHGGQ